MIKIYIIIYKSIKTIIKQERSHIISGGVLRIQFTYWNLLSFSNSLLISPVEAHHDKNTGTQFSLCNLQFLNGAYCLFFQRLWKMIWTHVYLQLFSSPWKWCSWLPHISKKDQRTPGDPPILKAFDIIVLHSLFPFVLKVTSKFHVNQYITLPVFYPQPQIHREWALHSLDRHRINFLSGKNKIV